MNAELMVGDPHINASTFITYVIINSKSREVGVASLAKFLTYFKQAFHQNYKHKDALFAYLVNITYEMLLLVRKYDKLERRAEVDDML